MAEVFRAVAEGVEGFRRVFVIKRLRPEKSASVELTRMFVDEARLSALLHHPNIVQVYDFGQINGTYFLAMEYLRGKDLAAVMKALRALKSAVLPPIAAHIAHQVATGLHYAHTLSRVDGKKLSVVHRDVTPSNIMLQRTGAVKVLDFGIAQATNFARQVETGGGRVKGKLAYLSPEQVRLEELDARSDVFALGIVLWEMLTGQRLFAAENEILTMRGVLDPPDRAAVVEAAAGAARARRDRGARAGARARQALRERGRSRRRSRALLARDSLPQLRAGAPAPRSLRRGERRGDAGLRGAGRRRGHGLAQRHREPQPIAIAAGGLRDGGRRAAADRRRRPGGDDGAAGRGGDDAGVGVAVGAAARSPPAAAPSDRRRRGCHAHRVLRVGNRAPEASPRGERDPRAQRAAPAANVAAAQPAPPADPSVAVAAEPVNAAPVGDPPSAPRTHAAKKHTARRLSNDVTIDPFK